MLQRLMNLLSVLVFDSPTCFSNRVCELYLVKYLSVISCFEFDNRRIGRVLMMLCDILIFHQILKGTVGGRYKFMCIFAYLSFTTIKVFHYFLVDLY